MALPRNVFEGFFAVSDPGNGPKLNYEELEDRLKSFTYPPPWNGVLDLYSMAEAGFVYTGQEDLVYCYNCSIKLDGWTIQMDPLMRHEEESPTCSFVRSYLRGRQERGNLVVYSHPVSPQMSASLRQPNYALHHNSMSSHSSAVVTGRKQGTSSALHPPDYANQLTRLQSFKYWGGVLPKEELVEAGFYMIARRDVVKCFSCRVVLQDWERTDNVIDKHLRYSPNCPFLTHLLYNDMTTASTPSTTGFVIDPLDTSMVPSSSSLPLDYAQLSSLVTSPLGTVPQSLLSGSNVAQSSSNVNIVSRHDVSMMGNHYWSIGEMQLATLPSSARPQHQYDHQGPYVNPVAASPHSTGTSFLHQSTLTAHNTSGTNGGSSSSLQEAGIERSRLSRGSTYDGNTVMTGHLMDHPSQTLENESVEAVEVSPETPQNGSSTTTLLVCDICRELQGDTALLPCGHAKICGRCAQRVISSGGRCPFCRGPVTGTLKIYF